MTTIYFATNRNPNDADKPTNFGIDFSENGYGDLRFGKAEVMLGKLVSESIEVLPDNAKDGSKELLKQLRTSMKIDEIDTLIFIHGFNVSFKNAIESAGLLSDRYKELSAGKYIPNIFVFSWPSDGSVIKYFDDRHDAVASGYAFARGLMKLTTFLRTAPKKEACEQKINLIAHSMGNYVLRHALQQAKKIVEGGSLSRIFDNIILTAADEDSDAFEFDYKLAQLPDLAQRITVYFNNADLTLKISDNLKANPDRLGHDGANNPHQLSAKIILVDASDVVTGDITDRHSYHLVNDKVGKDIIAVLQGERSESKKLPRAYVPHANKFRLEL
ncbi:MAG: alpha/beta hydrolase [Gammaproteobacteria bacterium]